MEQESDKLDEDMLFQVDPSAVERQITRLRHVRSQRSSKDVKKALSEVKNAAKHQRNIMPSVSEAVQAYASGGEICETIREVFGDYRAISVF